MIGFSQLANEPDSVISGEGIFHNDVLLDIMKNIEPLPWVEQAGVAKKLGDTKLKVIDPTVRSSKIKWLPQEGEFRSLYNILIDLISSKNKEYWNFDLHTFSENIQYAEYHAEDKGHYNWHLDLGPGQAALRKLSVTIQLSDPKDYEGGDLEFNQGGEIFSTAPKAKGSISIFPSYLLHRVTPVTKGVRKSLVVWVGGTHFR